MGARRIVLVALALAGGVCPITGCDLFRPRTPKPPGNTSVRCLNRILADSVQATIVQSYGSTSGLTCYTSSLDTSFMFQPDPTDLLEDPDPTKFANWNQAVETQDAIRIASDASFALAVFDTEYTAPSISPDGSIETHYYNYHVLFQSVSSTSATRYQGRADITYQKGSDAQWRITAWVDKRDGSPYPTWGRLRRIYRSGF